jgi:hypothetical protein
MYLSIHHRISTPMCGCGKSPFNQKTRVYFIATWCCSTNMIRQTHHSITKPHKKCFKMIKGIGHEQTRNMQIPLKKYWRGDKLAHRPLHPCHVMWARAGGRPCMQNARAWWVMGVGCCPLSPCHSAHIDCFPLHPLASLAVQPPLFHDPWLSHLHMHPQQKITHLAVCLWHWVEHKTENYEWVGLNSKLQRCQSEPAHPQHTMEDEWHVYRKQFFVVCMSHT